MKDDGTVRRSALRRVESHLRTRFMAGLVIVIPLVVTYLVLRLLFGFVNGLIEPAARYLPNVPFLSRFPLWLPALSIVLTAFVLYLAGVFYHTFVGRRLVALGHNLAERIPLVRIIYRATRQATEVFSGNHLRQFSSVVLVEFPRKGIKSIGLVTGRIRDSAGEELLTVYIPTTPNPTSGYLILVKAEEVTETDMTVDEAMKIVISGGILAEEVIRTRPAKPSQIKR